MSSFYVGSVLRRLIVRLMWTSASLLTLSGFAVGQLAVLPSVVDGVPKQSMMTNFLRNQAYSQLDQRDAAFNSLIADGSYADLVSYQQTMRANFVASLGNFDGFDRNAPLNPVITGSVDKSGYRIEKIRFESQPGHYATGVLFLPTRPEYANPPDGFPLVVLFSGHSEVGINSGPYRTGATLAANNGLATFMLEAIEQGEREQFVGSQGTRAHMWMGAGSILVGRTTGTFEAWDGIRAIDYLASRSDINGQKIGVMGSSGGGTQSVIAAVVDDRITAAAPSSYITSYRELFQAMSLTTFSDEAGPGDAEQHMFNQIGFGMDHADFMTMTADRVATQIAANRFDFFPIAGSRASYQQARQFYEALDPSSVDRIAIEETNSTHGWPRGQREDAVVWMARWLRGEVRNVTESSSTAIPTASEMQVTPTGNVRDIPGYRSTYDLNVEYDQSSLAPQRTQLWQNPSAGLTEVRRLTGIRQLHDLSMPTVTEAGFIQRTGYRIEKKDFIPEAGIHLPGLLFVPEATPITGATLYINEAGKHMDAGVGGQLEQLTKAGQLVLALDVRGIGETKQLLQTKFNPTWDSDYQDYYLAYLVGHTYVGMRAEDILVAARWLKDWQGSSGIDTVDLISKGDLGVPAIHAAALEHQLFDALTITGSLDSWTPMLSRPYPGQGMNLVHAALTAYDLPDLRRIADTVTGDLNFDGGIDLEDFAQIRSGYGRNLVWHTWEQAYPMGDLNQDFLINAIDYELFKATYAAVNGPDAAARDLPVFIPEPAAVHIALAALVCLVLCRSPLTRRAFVPAG